MPKYVGVNRCLLETGIVGDKNTLSVMMYLLLSTCDEAYEWDGETIPCGSVVTSHGEINEACRLTTNQTKYAIKKLKELKFFSTKFYRNKMVATVENKELFAIVKEKIPQVFPQVKLEKKLEKKVEKKEEPKPQKKKPISEAYTPEFERFWEQYPLKKAKKKAFEKWRSLKADENLQETILNDIARRMGSGEWKETQYIPHATTYLYGRRWEDEPVTASKVRGQKTGKGYYNPFKTMFEQTEETDETTGDGTISCLDGGNVPDLSEWPK